MFDLFAKPVGRRDDGGPTGYLWPEDNPSWSFFIRFPGKDREWFTTVRQRVDGETLVIWRDGAWVLANSLRIPALTASLDAALALCERVLPGARCMAERTFDGEGWAMVHPTREGIRQVSDGASPALALLAALLKAIIYQEQSHA
jgi:hypothetical protein